MIDRKCSHCKPVRVKEGSRTDLTKGDRRRPTVTTQHHTEDQIMDPVKGMAGAIDFNLLHDLPAKKGGDKTCQA